MLGNNVTQFGYWQVCDCGCKVSSYVDFLVKDSSDSRTEHNVHLPDVVVTQHASVIASIPAEEPVWIQHACITMTSDARALVD